MAAHTRRKSRTKERSSIGDSLRNADETHRLATRRNSWRKHGTPAPRQPQLPEEDYKVVIRPRGGFDTMQSSAIIKDGVLRAAGITMKDAEEDILRVNSKQNTFIMSTPKLENAKRYSQLKEIRIGTGVFGAAAYITAPDNTSKGVIRGIPDYDAPEDIEESLVNRRNPTILHARRMGRTDSVVIVFEGTYVPHYVYYRGAEYRCVLYRKKHELCTTCGRLGHRADVCPAPNTKHCRGCRMLNPTEDHQCDPRCSLCGKGHLTGDKQCREWFKTPYLLKKRYWERVQHEQQGTKQPRDDSTLTTSDHQGNRSSHETLRTRQDNATPTREIRRRSRSSSFPRLPPPEGKHRGHRQSRSPSRTRSRSPSRTRRQASPQKATSSTRGTPADEGVKVSWADTVSSAPKNGNRSALEKEIYDIRKALEGVIRENATQREEIRRLRIENKELRQNKGKEANPPTTLGGEPAKCTTGAPPAKRKNTEESSTDDITERIEKIESMITKLAETVQKQYVGIQAPLEKMQQIIEGIDSRVTMLENVQQSGRSTGIGPIKIHKPYDRPAGTDVTRAPGELVPSKHGVT